MASGSTGGLREILRSAGRSHRLTPQRLAVWQVLQGRPGHITADAIISALRDSFPCLNTGTVYRELSWLKDRGLICETDVGCGPKVYERVTEPPHHHLVCLSCGAVSDLPDSYFSGLRQALRDGEGFVPRIEHFAVYGACRSCAAQARRGDRPVGRAAAGPGR